MEKEKKAGVESSNTVTIQTPEAKCTDAAGARAKYDESAKIILSHKQFLARILKETVAELSGFSIEKIIMECLTEKPAISAVPVDRDDIPPKIESQNTEDTTMTEGKNFFDLKFNLRVPGDDKEIGLIINLESQKDEVKYPLEKRGLYYIGRLLSSQKGYVFKNDHYEKLRKVYSIWICMNVTRDKQNTVTVYNLNEHDIIGARKAKKEDFDLICMVMIGLGDPKEAEHGSMLKLLDVLFSDKIEVKEKMDLLETKCGIRMKDNKLAEEVETMCNLGQGIYERGLEQGLEQGEKRKAIEAAVNFLKLGKNSVEDIAMCTDLSVEEVKRLESEMCSMA